MNFNINIAPVIPYLYLFIHIGFMIVVALLAKYKGIKGLHFRCMFLVLLVLALFNPAIIKEVRQYLEDKLVVVVDSSDSMDVAQRKILAAKAVENIKASAKNLEVVVVNSQDSFNNGTNLFGDLKNNLASLPLNRVAGTVFITDGQVHDTPKNLEEFKAVAPLNAVIIGKKDEFDRKLSVVEAPKYGLVGDRITIKIRADVEGRSSAQEKLTLKIETKGENIISEDIPVGIEQEYEFKLDHAGQNVFEFSLAADKDELTDINNHRAVIVNGVRDRLRVLLVSGQPHIGERAWRNLLRSDPAVDLIHFTILRTPSSFDPTPTDKMSLIAFPVEELFKQKITDFDLIIFDKYVHYGLLYNRYFTNIANYVRNGGSFLMAMASDRVEIEIFASKLAEILPISPNIYEQKIVMGEYMPKLTEKGKSNAITSDLNLEAIGLKKWQSQISVKQTSGGVLMSGINDNPLLITDKVGKGRVAVLTSDNIWLWSKYPSSKGVYSDLQRKLAHWLMKEPELEEGYIKITRKDKALKISQRIQETEIKTINVDKPNGEKIILDLKKNNGWAEAEMEADKTGIYKFYNEKGSTVAVVGNSDSKEFTDMIATDLKLNNAVKQFRGKTIWYSGESLSAHDFNLQPKNSYQVNGMERVNIFSPWIYILFVMAGFLYVWRRES